MAEKVSIPPDLSPGIAAIIDREVAVIRDGTDRDFARTCVSRAAHSAARLTMDRLSADFTIDGIANVFGVKPATSTSDITLRRLLMREPISPEERARYGYGDLPDVLISDVVRQISGVMPEHAPQELATVVAALTMTVVINRPEMSPYELRRELQELNNQQPFVHSGVLPVDTLMALNGVVTIAQECTAAYVAEHNTLANIPIQQTEAVYG